MHTEYFYITLWLCSVSELFPFPELKETHGYLFKNSWQGHSDMKPLYRIFLKFAAD